jgi:hypothetical protein
LKFLIIKQNYQIKEALHLFSHLRLIIALDGDDNG